eukprot:6549156-Prymnesium_polylepis.1
MYGRPDHLVGVEAIWDGFCTAVGGLRTLACDPTHVYTSTTGKGLTTEPNSQPPAEDHHLTITTHDPEQRIISIVVREHPCYHVIETLREPT